MIYFVQADIVGRIKIGYSGKTKLEKRINALRTSSCVPLKVLVVRSGSRVTEARLHARFAAYRVHGEWFEPGRLLVAYIARLQGRRPAGPRRSAADRADAVLIQMFRDSREWPGGDFWRHIDESGVSRRTLDEAKKRLGIPRPMRRCDEEGNVMYVFRVPADWPHLAGSEA